MRPRVDMRATGCRWPATSPSAPFGSWRNISGADRQSAPPNVPPIRPRRAPGRGCRRSRSSRARAGARRAPRDRVGEACRSFAIVEAVAERDHRTRHIAGEHMGKPARASRRCRRAATARRGRRSSIPSPDAGRRRSAPPRPANRAHRRSRRRARPRPRRSRPRAGQRSRAPIEQQEASGSLLPNRSRPLHAPTS